MKGVSEKVRKAVDAVNKGELTSLFLVKEIYQEVLTTEEVELLSKAVEESPRFQDLVVSYTQIPSLESLLALLTALKAKTTMRRIEILYDSLNKEVLQTLVEVLSKQKQIEIFSLARTVYNSPNALKMDSIKAIASALATSNSLKKLTVVNNKLDDSDVIAFAPIIERNSKLKILRLNNNEIGDKGAKVLADIIKHHSSLSEIFLNNNKIGSNGISAITEAIEVNRSLTKLSLQKNKELGQNFKEALSQAITSNPLLRVVETDFGPLDNPNCIVSEEEESSYQGCIECLSACMPQQIDDKMLSDAFQYVFKVIEILPHDDSAFENYKKVLMLYMLRVVRYEAVMNYGQQTSQLSDLLCETNHHISLLLAETRIAYASYEICKISEMPTREDFINASRLARVLLKILPDWHAERNNCLKILRHYAINTLEYIGVATHKAIENSMFGVLPPEILERIFFSFEHDTLNFTITNLDRNVLEEKLDKAKGIEKSLQSLKSYQYLVSVNNDELNQKRMAQSGACILQ